MTARERAPSTTGRIETTLDAARQNPTTSDPKGSQGWPGEGQESGPPERYTSPWPSWLARLDPQHSMPPATVSAHAKLFVAATAVMSAPCVSTVAGLIAHAPTPTHCAG